MCGIVGFISGVTNSYELCKKTLTSLEKLEYRGYDSAGVATVWSGLDSINTIKKKGRIAGLISELESHKQNLDSKYEQVTTIAHTRWATHGKPSDINSHPHASEYVAVVHNGIIENFISLKLELQNEGFEFKSDTDTEVITQLITKYIVKEGITDFCEIGQKLLSTLVGSFAIAVLFKNNPGVILTMRRNAPLVVITPYCINGVWENAVGSDPQALVSVTKDFYYMQNDQFAILKCDETVIYDKKGKKVEIKFEKTSINDNDVSKCGYDHYMLKEIWEQPSVLQNNIKSHINEGVITFKNVKFNLNDFDHITLIACGTSYYACLMGKIWIEEIAGVKVDVELSSEFRYRKTVFKENSLYIFASQSGETADTLSCLMYVKQIVGEVGLKNVKILSLVNVKTSTMVRESDGFIECFAGPEIGVASTKNFLCQLISIYLLALKIADRNAKVSEIAEACDAIYYILNSSQIQQSIMGVARRLAKASKIMYIGRNILYPIALEGALKQKELNYTPVEGIAAGELKHGPIAIIDDSTYVVALDSGRVLHQKNYSSIQEVIARDGNVIVISDEEVDVVGVIAKIIVPQIKNVNLSVVLHSVVVQLISYYSAVINEFDVDKPRNLAKSVTVE